MLLSSSIGLCFMTSMFPGHRFAVPEHREYLLWYRRREIWPAKPLFTRDWPRHSAQSSGVGPEVLMPTRASVSDPLGPGRKLWRYPKPQSGSRAGRAAAVLRKGEPPRSKRQLPGRVRYHAPDAYCLVRATSAENMATVRRSLPSAAAL